MLISTRMKRLTVILLAVFLGCAPVSPRASLEERRTQRGQEFDRETKKNPTIVAAWNLKENLKKDYREIIGPSEAYDEKMDLQFSNAMNEAMLESPGQYERMAAGWARTRSDPVPTRDDIRRGIKTLDGRIKKLDIVLAQEIELAEQRAKDDAEKRQKIIQVIAGIALIALAVAGGAAAASAVSQPSYNSTTMGPYIITRTGPNSATIASPSRRVYTCITTGTYRMAIVNCY